MAKIDLKRAPYYDSTEQEAAQNYIRMVAVPGRVAQAREFTTMQGLMLNAIKSVGDSIMSNGDIIEGCQIIVSEDKRTVRVTPGKIYIDGIVLNVKESTIDISGKGEEYIGIITDETIITESEDSSLLDPVSGYDNYAQPGCSRVKRELKVVVNDPNSAVISRLIDGEIAVEKPAPMYEQFNKILARRTYDESGSYIVYGLTVRVEDLDEQYYNVVIEPGKAYILGYEITVPSTRRIKVERSLATKSIQAGNYKYNPENESYMLNSAPYVQHIDNVISRVEHTEQQTLRSNIDSVLLSQEDVISIESVKVSDTSYEIGSGPDTGDCYLLRDGSRYYVKWNGKNAPNPGTSYTVVYQYNAVLRDQVDYELKNEPYGSYLKFKEGGKTPVTDTSFTINYKQYLARKDLVYINADGDIKVLRGNPEEPKFEQLPSTPLNTLVLAIINNPPSGKVDTNINSLRINIDNTGLVRFTMQDIQYILDRVQRTEYNQAILTLNDDARSRETLQRKKGILTDPLIDFSRIDRYYNLVDGKALDPELPLYDMAVDLDINYCYLPLHIESYNMELNNGSYKEYERLVTLPVKGENKIISQPLATSSFLINPYVSFPQQAEVIISPAADNWVETETITVPVSLTKTQELPMQVKNLYNTARRSSSSNRVRISYSEFKRRFGTSSNIFGSDSITVGGSSSTTTSTSYSSTETGRSSNTSSSTSLLSDKAITYIRPREITVEGYLFSSNLDNIYCTFDGRRVDLTPLEGTKSGTEAGTLQANESGYVKGSFTIPEGVLTGTRMVELSCDTNIKGYSNYASTNYMAQGTLKTFQNTITTIETIFRQTTKTVTHTTHQSSATTYYYVDPLGQSFVVPRPVLLKGVEIFFEGKSDTDPVWLEIRGMTNGTIDSRLFGRKTLQAAEVVIDSKANQATRFIFDDPIALDADTPYALVIRSASESYRVWVAELGEPEVNSGEIVLQNAYINGLMFSSSNNDSWMVHQTTDVKFNLLEDIYETEGVINFQPIETNEVTRLDLLVGEGIFQDTSISWEYSTDSGQTYSNIDSNNIKELSDLVGTIIFRAKMKNDSGKNISPVIAKDVLNMIGSSYLAGGEYIGANVSGVDKFTNVDVILDTFIPPGTGLNVYVSTDQGKTWQETSLDNNQTRALNGGWEEHVYQISDLNNATECKLRIQASSNDKSKTPKFTNIKALMY